MWKLVCALAASDNKHQKIKFIDFIKTNTVNYIEIKINMGSQWTSKYAILRDLSFAQGRKVPAAIVDSVGVGQKPPSIKIKEDTEEEFYQNCVGDMDVSTKPDLGLIKEMIDMVRESDPAEDNDEGDIEKVVEISKLNPLCEDFVPNTNMVSAERKGTTNEAAVKHRVIKENTTQEIKMSKKRRQRNVALISLLEREQSTTFHCPPRDNNIDYCELNNLESENKPEVTRNGQHLEVKLLKPNDFILDSIITEAVEKVNEWLQKPVSVSQSETNESQLEKTNAINFSPKSMFKSKKPALISLENTCMFKRKSDTSSIKSSDSDTVPRHSENVFVPSTHANEYYKKFVERHQVQGLAKEDIWKRAERLMKEIDVKRLKEIELNTEGQLNNTESPNAELEGGNGLIVPGLTAPPAVRQSILLSQHRHELLEDCKVCLALAKYKHLSRCPQ